MTTMNTEALAKYREAQVGGNLLPTLYLLIRADIGCSKRANTIYIFERSLAGQGVEVDASVLTAYESLETPSSNLQTSLSNTVDQHSSLSFREFVEALKCNGNLVEIESPTDPSATLSDSDFEVGEKIGKAFLFNNAQGMRSGFFRLLCIPNSLGYHPNPNDEIVASDAGTGASLAQELLIREQAEEYSNLVRPILSHEALCKENKVATKQIDLTVVPSLSNQRVNGARLIELHGLLVTHIPSLKWTTWRITRARVSGHNKLRFPVQGLAQTGQEFSELEDFSQVLPFTFCFGVAPAIITAASSPLSDAMTKAKYVGIIAGQSLNLIKSDTNDLLIPSSCEIVFEGSMTIPTSANTSRSQLRARRGSIQLKDAEFELTVDLITYRDEPIMPVPFSHDMSEEAETSSHVL